MTPALDFDASILDRQEARDFAERFGPWAISVADQVEQELGGRRDPTSATRLARTRDRAVGILKAVDWLMGPDRPGFPSTGEVLASILAERQLRGLGGEVRP